MASYEARSTSGPEDYLNDLLAWRPPLPVDQRDLGFLAADIAERTATEPGYAWERLPRWLTQTDEVYDTIGNDPIICLDVCSSLPLYAQLLRAHEFSRAGERAREITRGFFANDTIQQLKNSDPSLQSLAAAMSPDKEARSLLSAAIQESLYTLVATETEAQHIDQLRQRIGQQLVQQNVTYEQDERGSDVESGWRLRFKTVVHEQDYLTRLTSLPVPSPMALRARRRLEHGSDTLANRLTARDTIPTGRELAVRFIDWQAYQLAQFLKENKRFRPVRFLSMDVSDPQEIALSSLVHTPPTTQALHLFSHAINSLYDPRQHIQGDIVKPLPFPDNSMALITCFDGWPFYSSYDEADPAGRQSFAENCLTVLTNFYNKLNYGGKIVIFPWTLRDATADNYQLLYEVTVEFGRRVHHGIDKKILHRDTLADWMSDSDRTNSAARSPLFTSNNSAFEALVVTKPGRSVVKLNRRLTGHTALREFQTQDSPGPRP